MNREQLCHVLRAAAEVTGFTDLVVIGSQAVLGTYEEWLLPVEATRSAETDIAVDIALAGAAATDDETELADRIDGAIGEGSMFHQSFGYYGQGVETITATLTTGWRDRLVPLNCNRADGVEVDAVGWCLEINDLWLSKAAAGREKDHDFCLALAAQGLVDLDQIERRLGELAGRDRENARVLFVRARSSLADE